MSRSRRRSARSASWSRPATSAISACPRSVPRPCAAPPRSTRSATCRSSTRCSRAGSRRRSCRLPRAGHRHHRVRRALTRSPQRALDAPSASGAGDFRSHTAALPGREPRAQPGAGRGAARAGAGQRRARVAQVAIAWVAARGGDIVPLLGAAGVTASTRRSAPSTSAERAESSPRSSEPSRPTRLPVADSSAGHGRPRQRTLTRTGGAGARAEPPRGRAQPSRARRPPVGVDPE